MNARRGSYHRVSPDIPNSANSMASSNSAGGDRASVAARVLKVANSPKQELALTNKAYCSPSDAQNFPPSAAGDAMIRVTNHVFSIVLTVEPNTDIANGRLGLNAKQRETIRVSTNDDVQIEQFVCDKSYDLVMLGVEVVFFRVRGNQDTQLDAIVLSQKLKSSFGMQMMTVGQMVPFEFLGRNYIFIVKETNLGDAKDSKLGRLTTRTELYFETVGNSGIKITNQKGGGGKNIFKTKDINFQKLGIGGLDNEFQDIFRRAFASRVYSPEMISKLGIQHVKGMLLWGPPGTGKTLIARQIGKMLNGREPKIVNGPEVLSKFVGETEKNVRDLFADAENDQRSHGDQSELHIIIFDEIDAICKARGSTRDGTGVHDSIVNQLLTKIDGVEALNNILLIGMTNRKDMLDEALLRPGRLEVQIEIGLPDESGRFQILQIHSSKMRENSFLSADVNLDELAERTKNFSGAELEGLVKSAVSFALNRQVNIDNLEQQLDEENIKVTMMDFECALEEVKPAFGAAIATLDRCRVNGMLDCGSANGHVQTTAIALVELLKTSDRTPLYSCLLEGPSGSGKTAIAATVAIESGFPFIKIISAENMVGVSESTKCGMINKVFEDAYKSPLSIIIIDDIERILEYVSIGLRFSNVVLQTLLVLIKRIPPKGRNLFVIGTTSKRDVMESMDVLSAFNVLIPVPMLNSDDMRKVLEELRVFTPRDEEEALKVLGEEMPIKKLLMLIEMSKHGGVDADEKIAFHRFVECYNDLS